MRTRRHFLSASAATLAATALPRHLLAQRRGGDVFANANLAAAAQGLLNLETFQNLLGDVFTMFVEDYGVAYLRLARITDWNSVDLETLQQPVLPGSFLAAATPRQPAISSNARKTKVPSSTPLTRFTLSFTNTGSPFTQDSFILDHGRLGRFTLFVVPTSSAVCHATFCSFANTPSPKVVLPSLTAAH